MKVNLWSLGGLYDTLNHLIIIGKLPLVISANNKNKVKIGEYVLKQVLYT